MHRRKWNNFDVVKHECFVCRAQIYAWLNFNSNVYTTIRSPQIIMKSNVWPLVARCVLPTAVICCGKSSRIERQRKINKISQIICFDEEKPKSQYWLFPLSTILTFLYHDNRCASSHSMAISIWTRTIRSIRMYCQRAVFVGFIFHFVSNVCRPCRCSFTFNSTKESRTMLTQRINAIICCKRTKFYLMENVGKYFSMDFGEDGLLNLSDKCRHLNYIFCTHHREKNYWLISPSPVGSTRKIKWIKKKSFCPCAAALNIFEMNIVIGWIATRPQERTIANSNTTWTDE